MDPECLGNGFEKNQCRSTTPDKNLEIFFKIEFFHAPSEEDNGHFDINDNISTVPNLVRSAYL
jgi:hypothetical protein